MRKLNNDQGKKNKRRIRSCIAMSSVAHMATWKGHTKPKTAHSQIIYIFLPFQFLTQIYRTKDLITFFRLLYHRTCFFYGSAFSVALLPVMSVRLCNAMHALVCDVCDVMCDVMLGASVRPS